MVRFGARSLALFLSLSFGLSESALALRNQQQEDPTQLAGLEEALKDPAKAIRQLAQLVTPAPSQKTSPNLLPGITSENLEGAGRAGLEEPDSKVLKRLDALIDVLGKLWDLLFEKLKPNEEISSRQLVELAIQRSPPAQEVGFSAQRVHDAIWGPFPSSISRLSSEDVVDSLLEITDSDVGNPVYAGISLAQTLREHYFKGLPLDASAIIDSPTDEFGRLLGAKLDETLRLSADQKIRGAEMYETPQEQILLVARMKELVGITVGLEESSEVKKEAIAILGSGKIRSGKWSRDLLPHLDRVTLDALIDNPRQTVSQHEVDWKKAGWLRGGGAAKLLVGDVGEAVRRAKEVVKRATPQTSQTQFQPLLDPVRIVFSYHGTSGDGQWTAEQIQLMQEGVEHDRPIVIWLEHASPVGLPVDYPGFERLLSHVYGMPPGWIRQEMARQPMDPQFERVLREIYQSFQSREISPQAYLQQLGDPFGLKVRGAVARLSNRQRVQISWEESLFTAYVNHLKMGVMQGVAFGFLAEGNHEEALRRIASTIGYLREADRLRDEALVLKLTQAHRTHPNALHIVIRGIGHAPVVTGIVSQQGIRVRTVLQQTIQSFDPVSRFQSQGFPSFDSAEGRRLLFEILLSTTVWSLFKTLTLPDASWTFQLYELTSSFPPSLVESWFDQVAPLGRGSLQELGARTWAWIGTHQEDMTELGRQLHGALQGAVEQASRGAGTTHSDAGLEELQEERDVAIARELAVVVLGKVYDAPSALAESHVLIFTDPGTFDLVPLAVRWGRTVGVDYDGPEADALRELLRLALPKGAYAIGRDATRMLLRESENPVWIANREDALRRLGLNPDGLPPVVREAIEITRDYLGQFV